MHDKIELIKCKICTVNIIIPILFVYLFNVLGTYVYVANNNDH